MQKLLTPQEIAEILGVKPGTIYQWTHQGFIPHVKLGRLVRFRESEILKWVEKRSQAGRLTKRISIQELGLGDMDDSP